MTEKTHNPSSAETGRMIHLPKRREPRSSHEEQIRELDLKISEHFRYQNDLLSQHNREQGERIQRLTAGIERLVTEMHGVRTGEKEEAFARVGPIGVEPDLPMVSGESALFYTCTAKQIGAELGFNASQIGALLGRKGLKWVGKGEYQEIGRACGPSDRKYWHREVPQRLRGILDENRPERFGITDKAVLAIFRRWKERQAMAAALENLDTTASAH